MENEKTTDILVDTDYSDEFIPKHPFELDKNDGVFTLLAVIACVFTAIFGFFGGFALGFAISVVILNVLFLTYFSKVGKPCFFSILCLTLSLINSTVFVFTSNSSVRFFASVICALLSFVSFDEVVSGRAVGNKQTLGVFFSSLSSVSNSFAAVKSVFSIKDGNKKSIGKIFIGILCALPVLFVVVPLLISSDEAFSGMISNVSDKIFGTLLKAILGILVSVFAISYGFSLKYKRTSKLNIKDFEGFDNLYVISFLSAISVSYFLYLFSQLAYFFSAFSGFLPNGEISYAEYARKGFFEMCAIAVINLLIVFLSLIFSKKKDGKVCTATKSILTFIAVFTLIIISTAISKMLLYINTYGMTVLRITTSAFMVFLAITFVGVILRIYMKKINIIKTSLVCASLIIFLLGTVNVNAVCAKYNYENYISGQLDTVDVNALYELGDEGIPYIVKLAKSYDEYICYDAKRCLAFAYAFDYFAKSDSAYGFDKDTLYQSALYNSFEYFNLPRQKAYTALYKYIDENPEFAFEHREYLSDYSY